VDEPRDIKAHGISILADHLGSSGPLETVAASIVVGVCGRTGMPATTCLQAGVM
jgi:hypothetical protein